VITAQVFVCARARVGSISLPEFRNQPKSVPTPGVKLLSITSDNCNDAGCTMCGLLYQVLIADMQHPDSMRKYSLWDAAQGTLEREYHLGLQLLTIFVVVRKERR
jgi:hypothetical protein